MKSKTLVTVLSQLKTITQAEIQELERWYERQGKKFTKLYILFACTVLLSACGTTGPVNLSKLSEPVPANKARLLVERDNSLLYLAAAVTVQSNGTKIASLGRGGSIIHDIPKGDNTLSVSTPTAFGQFAVKFNAITGETYHFQVSPRGGALVTGSAWGNLGDAINARVSEQSGYFKIEPKM